MTHKEAKDLLERYELGECSTQEASALESWYEQLLEKSDMVIPDAQKQVYYHQILNNINNETAFRDRKVARLWPRLAVTAAIVLIISSTAIWFYKDNPGQQTTQLSTYKNDAAPGKYGATLTLANGKKIALTGLANGELADESGVSISKASNGQLIYKIKGTANGSGNLNTLTTANGETYKLQLPDGTIAYLNAASSLTYAPSLLENGKRIVQLRGEGYFEVTKDKNHPFIVKSSRQEVEVMGTHFNVNAYPDEGAVITTLIEGSVKVTSAKMQIILKPGYQSVNDNEGIKKKAANLGGITDWKDGDFNLEGVDFKSAMRKIARWYNVEVIYNDDVPDDVQSVGMISRDKKLSSILNIIEASGQVKFKIEGQKVFVSP